jgi:hypothetical protein
MYNIISEATTAIDAVSRRIVLIDLIKKTEESLALARKGDVKMYYPSALIYRYLADLANDSSFGLKCALCLVRPPFCFVFFFFSRFDSIVFFSFTFADLLCTIRECRIEFLVQIGWRIP